MLSSSVYLLFLSFNKIINKSLCFSLFNYKVNSRCTCTRQIQEVRIDFETLNVNMVQK